MKKVLVTGISGFAGSFLAEHLLAQGNYQISGTYLDDSSLRNLDKIKDSLNLVKINLLENDQVAELVASIKPDYIYHLAALTVPKDSFANPAQFINNNLTAQINLLEAVRNQDLIATRILVVSSGDAYGLVDDQNLPIDEQVPFKPTNPYAVSKIAQDYLGLQYYLAYQLAIIRVRPFNHIGPRQSPNFVVSSFAQQIAEIEKGAEPVLKVGNLDSKRDFTDVRDMVRAYQLILEQGEIGEVYNIGSGKSQAISAVLNLLLKLSTKEIQINTSDKSLLRPSDQPNLVCNASKMQAITNWQPEIPFSTTLKDTLDYWRGII